MYLRFVPYHHKRLKYITDSTELNDHLHSFFSIPNPAFGYGPFSKEITTPITLNNTFPEGLVLDIIEEVKKSFPSTSIEIKNIRKILQPLFFNPEQLEQPENKEFVYRDYQEEAIRKCLKIGRGTIVVSTAGGKSCIIYGLIKNLWRILNKCKIFILVPNIQLVKQMHSDFIEYGCSPFEVCMFSSFSPEISSSANIIIGNRQWIQNHRTELLDSKVVIIDEVHQIRNGNNITKLLSKFSTSMIFGFTGTFPKDKELQWSILGTCGKVLINKGSSEFQEAGIIANLKIFTYKFVHHTRQPEPSSDIIDKFKRAKMRYPLEWKFIIDCEFTNNFICDFVYKLNGNSIILYDFTEHGEKLKKRLDYLNLTGKKKTIYHIFGETELEIREEARETMEKNNEVIIVANTKCFGTGINIKNISHIIFAFTHGKSAIKICQAIGRALRIIEDRKDTAYLHDFWHSFKYGREHFKIRQKLYLDNYKVDKLFSTEINVI